MFKRMFEQLAECYHIIAFNHIRLHSYWLLKTKNTDCVSYTTWWNWSVTKQAEITYSELRLWQFLCFYKILDAALTAHLFELPIRCQGNFKWKKLFSKKKALGLICVLGLLYINCTLLDFCMLVQDLSRKNLRLETTVRGKTLVYRSKDYKWQRGQVLWRKESQEFSGPQCNLVVKELCPKLLWSYCDMKVLGIVSLQALSMCFARHAVSGERAVILWEHEQPTGGMVCFLRITMGK